MPEPLTFFFGSRSGSYTALAFFAAIFALVGGVAARELRRRGSSRRPAVLVGALLFVGPLLLIHLTSTGGFYEADVRDRSLTLRYLIWRGEVEVPLTRILRIEARPAFRGRWRLHLRTTDGAEYDSATATRAVVESASDRVLRLTSSP
jgi:hypothetical protein